MAAFRLFILFSRNCAGCITAPYATYRKLAKETTDFEQSLYIIFLSVAYFGFASIVRSGFNNPFLLTLKFNALVIGAVAGFLFITGVYFLLGRALGGTGTIKTIAFLWSFTLLPTIIWFFGTSILYLLFPPPRTLSIPGKTYSLFFTIFSLGLLYWKLILAYLTLRFGIKLDLYRIVFIALIMLPLIGLYSLIMYHFKIFRIPFL